MEPQTIALPHRKEIDGLRAVAVLPVVLFHAGAPFFGGGYIGVDVFFVISGYLITTIIATELDQGRFSLARFYERRARRILPALFVVLLACVPAAFVSMVPNDIEEFAASLIAAAAFFANIYYWQESDYFAIHAHLEPLLHTWSLAVEEQFYLLFPLVLMFLWRFRARLVLAAFCAGLAVSLVSAHFLAEIKPLLAFYLLPTRAWELLAGGLAALFVIRRGLPSAGPVGNQWLSVAGIALIAFATAVFDVTTEVPGLPALIPVAGAILIILFATGSTFVGRLLSSRVAVGIGLISYSLYLWHQPLYAFARNRFGLELGVLPLLGLTILAFALSYATWKYVETPARNRRYPSRRAVFAFSATATAIVLCVGVAIRAGDFGGQRVAINDPYEPCGMLSPGLISDDLCIYGNDDAAETVVLMGDSHAWHLSRALNEAIGDQYRIIQMVCGGCYFGEAIQKDGWASWQVALDNVRRSIPELAAYDIKAVIRSQRWHGYQIREPEQIEAAVSDSLNFFDIPYDIMVIVGSVADVDLPCELINHYRPEQRRPCDSDAATHKFSQAFVDTTSRMEVPDNVHFVYPYRHVCGFPDGCRVIEGEASLYHDSHHLTLDGAGLPVAEIARLLSGASVD